MRRLSAFLTCACLLGGATTPALGADDPPPPEEPVGAVAYHGWRFTGDKLPAKGKTNDGPDAPRSTAVPETGPALALQTSYIGRDAAEPTLGVNRNGVAFYAASAFDQLAGATPTTRVFRSQNGGRNWQDISPQAAGLSLPPTTLDPYVYVDQRTDRLYSIDLALAGSYLNYSDDGGATWQTSALTTPGVNDHQTFFSGPPPVETALFPPSLDDWPTVVYYCVNALAYVGCSRSTDGGQTFRDVSVPPFTGCEGCQTGHGVVDKDGRVFLPRGNLEGGDIVGVRNQVAISTDGASTWKLADIGKGVPSASRHTAVAVDTDENVYYVWYDPTFQLPWLSISRDHGTTWSKPLMVAPPGVHDANFPMIAAGAPGRIAISFPGSSVDGPDDETRPWHAWVTVSTDALSENPTFHAAIGDDGKDPLHRGSCDDRCSGMYDFIDLQVSPKDGSVWGSFTDTCTSGNDCDKDRDPGLATDAEGVAVRTVGGPMLFGDPVGAAPVRPADPLPSSPSPVDRVKPRVLSLKVKGRKLTWKLSEPASIKVVLRRGRKRIASQQTGRPAKRGSLTLRGARRGRFTLVFTATDRAGNRGRAITRNVRFR